MSEYYICILLVLPTKALLFLSWLTGCRMSAGENATVVVASRFQDRKISHIYFVCVYLSAIQLALL